MKPGSWILLAALAAFVAAAPARATVVVIAPHPDDGEASCGGLIANTTAAGESVIVLTMTGGELAVYGKKGAEARAVREAEGRRAAARLGARTELFGALDGSLAVTAESAAHLREMLLRLRPRLVTAPWPLDVHSDHQAAGLLAWRVFQDPALDFELYFYETSNSPHTVSFGFVPTNYVDISTVWEAKREAVLEHHSQGPQDWVGMYEVMATQRGYESDVRYAEAYVRARNSSGIGGRGAATPKVLPAGAR